MIIGIMNVVTNIAYLISAWMSFRRRIYDLFAWYVGVFVASSLHHLCKDIGVCIVSSPEHLQILDHILAHIAISRTFLIISNYDLVRVNEKYLNPPNSTLYHTRAMAYSYKYVLVKTRFSDLASAFYTAVVIFSSLTAFATPTEYLTVILTGIALVIMSYCIHILGLRKRFLWKSMLMALVLISISAILYTLPEHESNLLHPTWHLTSAYAAAFVLLGATQHMRIFPTMTLLSHPI